MTKTNLDNTRRALLMMMIQQNPTAWKHDEASLNRFAVDAYGYLDTHRCGTFRTELAP